VERCERFAQQEKRQKEQDPKKVELSIEEHLQKVSSVDFSPCS